MSALPPVLAEKPLLRGVSHQVAFYLTAVAGAFLVASAPSRHAMLAAAIYAATLATMFGVSALYHRLDWSPASLRRMRRLDHSAIFLVIAGTYTPICLLGLHGAAGAWLLGLAWCGAILGILQANLWINAPRPLATIFYVLLGLVVLPFLPAIGAALGPGAVALVSVGGGLYLLGAVAYALRRPDPLPAVFGYHEVFHALTIAASVCHFLAVHQVVAAG